MAFFPRFALVLAAIGLVGCSLAFDFGEVQCDEAADCAERGFEGATCQANVCVQNSDGGGGTTGPGGGGEGGAPDPSWACLGGFMPPEPKEDVTHEFQFELATEGGVAPEGLTVRLCALLDVNCETPIETLTTDAAGQTELTVAPSFEGFMEVESDETIPSLAFLGTLVTLPPSKQVIRLIRPNEFAALVTAAGQVYDMTDGVAVVLTQNCDDARALGVKISSSDIDDDTVQFYFNGSLPDPQSTQTDDQGAAGFLNLPPGLVTVEARRASNDEFIGIVSFRSKAGHLTYVPVRPTADPN
jgi:hypothetical protein